jgi:hypothetical protein
VASEASIVPEIAPVAPQDSDPAWPMSTKSRALTMSLEIGGTGKNYTFTFKVTGID